MTGLMRLQSRRLAFDHGWQRTAHVLDAIRRGVLTDLPYREQAMQSSQSEDREQ